MSGLRHSANRMPSFAMWLKSPVLETMSVYRINGSECRDPDQMIRYCSMQTCLFSVVCVRTRHAAVPTGVGEL